MNKKKPLDWGAISLDSLFTFERGKEKNMAALSEGSIPLVSARKVNNGVKGFVSNPIKIIVGGQSITLNNDGDGGAGLAYYQPMDFALDTHVTALHPKMDQISPYALLYITASISKQHAIFGHGRSISLSRAMRIRDMLPVCKKGNPDFAYMTEYTKQKQISLISRYKSYCVNQLSRIEYKRIPLLSDKEWKSFSLDEIFVVKPGKRLETRNKINGKRPFIGASDNGNGITGFVGNDNVSKDKRVLGVNYNGAPCIAFYHPYECVFSDDVKRLHFKNRADNKFMYLFFVAIFAQQKTKFSYGYKFNEQRMLRQKLMVPVKGDGEPDYEYMEQYAKNMMLKKYKQYLSFLERKEQKQQLYL